VSMELEADGLEWPLSSEGSFVRLTWRMLGPVAWSGSAAAFPPAPSEPGIYLIRVRLGQTCRVYIGEAADLGRRLRRYGGRADERPNQRGMTTSNMRGRIRRTYRAGGSAEVYLLELPVRQVPERDALDPGCKDCRIVLERLALTAAYLRGEHVINEHGFPGYPPGDPLQ
jgi:hypothetical protein